MINADGIDSVPGIGTGSVSLKHIARQAAHAAEREVMLLVLGSGNALGQGKPTCTPQGKVQTAQKVVGQVVKVDAGLDKLTVREDDGTVHEFQASKEALREFKAGDRIEAMLR